MDGLSIVLIAIGILGVLILLAGVKAVPQGFNFTVERFGRYTRTLTPGLNVIVPFIERLLGIQFLPQQIQIDPAGAHDGHRVLIFGQRQQ